MAKFHLKPNIALVMLSWQWPWVVILLPLPWLLRKMLRTQTPQTPGVRLPFFQTLQHLNKPHTIRQGNRVSGILSIAVWLCLLVSVARPVWFGEPVNIATSGRDLLLAIDLSDSMRIDDMLVDNNYVTRISTIKSVASEFIERRDGDRLGLILFGQRSYLQTPLTFDRHSVAVQLNEALPGFAGSSTAIGDAIGLAISTLRDRPAESRVLVLMTDGANTAGSEPQDAVKVASESGIRIHTIGVGAEAKRIVDFAGREKDIDPSKDLDETSLQAIAQNTGGEYFRARDPDEMKSIYAVIDELEPAADESLLRPQSSLYHWPLTFAFLASIPLLLRAGRDLA